MNNKKKFNLITHFTYFISLLILSVSTGAVETLRLDYFHSGNFKHEIFSFDQLVIEPLPWPGNSNHPIDKLLRGKYLVEISENNKRVYSKSFSSIYGEWETTEQAKTQNKTFHESIRFPKPQNKFTLTLKKRNTNNQFQTIWTTQLDPNDYMNFHEPASYQKQVLSIHYSGKPSEKVDLLILGDGYTQAEQSQFKQKAQQLTHTFFLSFPFSEHKKDFNVWALAPVAKESGISRPSTHQYIDSPLATSYDAFRSERYLLTFDNKKWRKVASSAPYDAVIIITNSETYGGGGIYGLYSTAAANSIWDSYLFIHEFGHHFAGLADEYFTSSVAYQPPAQIQEPYEPNITALLDPKNLKWKHWLKKGTTVPTPWPKVSYEKHALAYQKIRTQLRVDNRPEAEMNKLFIDNQKFVENLFNQQKDHQLMGAYEGANYQSKGYYRPAMNCIMFTRTKDYDAVCAEAIEQMIATYIP